MKSEPESQWETLKFKNLQNLKNLQNFQKFHNFINFKNLQNVQVFKKRFRIFVNIKIFKNYKKFPNFQNKIDIFQKYYFNNQSGRVAPWLIIEVIWTILIIEVNIWINLCSDGLFWKVKTNFEDVYYLPKFLKISRKVTSFLKV